jgi:hypothetical protein
MAYQKQLANIEIRGVTPARDLPSLLQVSINLASAIQILDARTKVLDELINSNERKNKTPRYTFPPLKQVRGDKKTDDTNEDKGGSSIGGDTDSDATITIGDTLSKFLELSEENELRTITNAPSGIVIPVMVDGTVKLYYASTLPDSAYSE